MREMQERLPADDAGWPGPDRVVSPDSAGRVLLAATARALRGVDCADLGYQPLLSRLRGAPESVRRLAVARAAGRAAVAACRVGAVDVERVARWMVAHYRPRWYPGAVLGSPHGAGAHLATALGVPWLPTGFEMVAHWPQGAVDDPAGALAYGRAPVAALLAANPGVRVRQVHDPVGRGVLAGSTITLVVRWTWLPEAYRRFLGTRLVPGAPVLLLADGRTWPVVAVGAGHTFQVSGPASGLEPGDFRPGTRPLRQLLRSAGADPARWNPPDAGPGEQSAEQGVEPGFEAGLRGWAGQSGSALHRVSFPQPEVLSAATADVYRRWLRDAGKTGDRCVVECGRLLDPWQVVRAGLVPYWCENATRRSVAGAEWWLAGSAPFTSVDVLPEPPGMQSPMVAGLRQWLAVASFGRLRRSVDRTAARAYPVVPVPTRHATEALRQHPYDLPSPPPLRLPDALGALRDSGVPAGLLIC